MGGSGGGRLAGASAASQGYRWRAGAPPERAYRAQTRSGASRTASRPAGTVSAAVLVSRRTGYLPRTWHYERQRSSTWRHRERREAATAEPRRPTGDSPPLLLIPAAHSTTAPDARGPEWLKRDE